MPPSARRIIAFVNVAHVIDHWFMLIFPTAVLGMGAEFGLSYDGLIALAVGGFIAFGAGSLPSGWLGDRWSRRNMMAVFFVGIGLATILTGFAMSSWQLAVGLGAMGLFASIYHPVGTAMLVSHAEKLGREIGINGVWGNLGVASASLVTGALTQWLGWRWAFFIPGTLALAVGGLYLLRVPDEENRSAVRGAARDLSVPRPVLLRAFAVLILVTLAGGVVFNATTVAMPKLFDERLAGLAGSAFGVGALVFCVYVTGAVAQLIVGRVIDRLPLKIGFLPLALCQAPLLLACAFADGWVVIAAAVGTIFVIFGQVTINDGMVAKYTNAAWRGRVYAVRYLLSFGVSACAVPLVAALHDHGGFRALFVLLAACGFVVFLGALLFPYRPEEIVPPQPASSPVAAE
jgi:MFS family permease